MSVTLLQKSAALAVCLLLSVSLCLPAGAEELEPPAAPPAAAEPAPNPPEFLALSYTSSRDAIHRGEVSDLTVTLKDTALLTRDFRVEDYDFSKLIDSFSACTPGVEVLSAEDEPVTLRLTCAGVSYSGTGQSLKLSAARKGGGPAQTVEITVVQAVEYTPPVPTPKPEPTPTPAPKEQPAPAVVITRSALAAPQAANQAADIVVTFHNAGKTRVLTPQAVFTPSESLLLVSDTSTILLPDIEPGKSQSVTVRVQAGKEIAAASQALAVELKYNYDNAGTLTAASAADKLNLAAVTTGDPAQKTDAATPNIVVRDFTYGQSNIAAGSRFTLDFRFQNMGRLRVENVVASVDGGENFALDGGTSTFYYDALPAKGEQKQSVPLQALPTAKSGAQAVTVQFKYEYVDGNKRTAASSEVRMAVPVVQQDRFQINAPALPESCTAGEECVLTLNYVNRGKTDVSNVEAAVEGDGFDAAAKTQYVGNITAGTSGSIGFALTPNQAGKVKVLLKVTYEDPNLQPQTKEFPVELTVGEGALPDDLPMDDLPEEKPFPWPLLALIPLGGVIAGAVVVLRRGGKGKTADPVPAWEPWPDEETPGGPEE